MRRLSQIVFFAFERGNSCLGRRRDGAKLLAVVGDPAICPRNIVFRSNALGDDQTEEVAPDYICKCQFKKVPNIAGDYSGTIDDSNGTGTLVVTLTQHRAHIDGTWTSSYSDGSGDNGAVAGTVKQKVVKIQFLTSNPKCKYHGVAAIGSNTLQGAVAASRSCTIDSATFTLDKQ